MSFTAAPVIDLLIRIKNAYMVRKISVEGVIYSNFKIKLLELLKRSKFIADWQIEKVWSNKFINIELFYEWDYNELVPVIKIYSKPSRKYYIWYKDIKWVAGWRGVWLISTSKWLMFTHEAREQKVWWELIAEIY